MFLPRATPKSLKLKEIEVNLRHNPRAKRILIKVRHGKVDLVIPRRASVKTAVRFLESKESWIRLKLAGQPRKIPLEIGARLCVLGVSRETIYGCMRGKSEISDTYIKINGDPKLAPKKIRQAISEYLKAELEKTVAEKAALLKVKYNKITIRSTVSRWGSCSSTGNLSFCWLIAFAPRSVMEYLAAHEVAHLAEMNHGKNFWNLVASLHPEYAAAEQWLKKNGAGLHLYN